MSLNSEDIIPGALYAGVVIQFMEKVNGRSDFPMHSHSAKAPIEAQPAKSETSTTSRFDSTTFILQLQKSIGNRATAQLMGSHAPLANSRVLQAYRTEQEAIQYWQDQLEGELPNLFLTAKQLLDEAQRKKWDDLEELVIDYVREHEDETTDMVLDDPRKKLNMYISLEKYDEALAEVCKLYAINTNGVPILSTDDYSKQTTESGGPGIPNGLTLDNPIRVFIHQYWIKEWIAENQLGDLVSTIQHELVHARQNEEGRTGDMNIREFEAYFHELKTAYANMEADKRTELPTANYMKTTFHAAKKHLGEISSVDAEPYTKQWEDFQMEVKYHQLFAYLSDNVTDRLTMKLFKESYKLFMEFYQQVEAEEERLYSSMIARGDKINPYKQLSGKVTTYYNGLKEPERNEYKGNYAQFEQKADKLDDLLIKGRRLNPPIKVKSEKKAASSGNHSFGAFLLPPPPSTRTDAPTHRSADRQKQSAVEFDDMEFGEFQSEEVRPADEEFAQFRSAEDR
jgi:hypothetical protein